MRNKFILLTGCSGGGKSTLLDALSKRGFSTVLEPGRRIVEEEIAGDSKALPWIDMNAFAMRAIEIARSDLEAAQLHCGPVFFDRGLIDAAVALEYSRGPSLGETIGDARVYSSPVFLFPPWKEIFESDAVRKHDFQAAVEEYHRTESALNELGYEVLVLPRVSVDERVEFVLHASGIA
ncbi:AAA family ATPase [Ruegeria sp. R13_0]|uniref:AAA family ATPase n=1 Tax=Ruegeria sp. R13_0 TaxID=2821099 RepID=UPI001ADCDAA5|nr:AAA family ATPase [Ruegeria sp. R13_0]MBO9436371.1 AAA family ATPase [Ruegeria sp. R13_0]